MRPRSISGWKDIEDIQVTGMISAAREHVENWTQRAILEGKWKLYLSNLFPTNGIIELPRPVATAVTDFTYYDSEGAAQTLVEDTDFRFNKVGTQKSFLEPIGTWPTTDSSRNNAVEISFDAGWPVSDVPNSIRQAILVTVADMYERRQSQIYGMSVNATKAMESLTSTWRVDP
jgi:uncharacterized phiE125 gp8 family phage protein